MQGLSGFFEVMNDPYRGNAERWAQRTASSFLVPAVVRDVAYINDPLVRHVGSMLDAIKARTPGLSTDLPARLDEFGRERNRRSDLGPIYDAVSPFYRQSIKVMPIQTEMNKHDMNFRLPTANQTFKTDYIFKNAKSVEVPLKKKFPYAYYRFVELYGQEDRYL
jgi:hypothetical protein